MAGALRGRRPRLRTVYKCVRHHSVRKWKHIPCFEVGLSLKGLTHHQNKVYTFALRGLACVTIQCVHYYVVDFFCYTLNVHIVT